MTRAFVCQAGVLGTPTTGLHEGIARVAYGAKDISILKGLQPVRERPGMYIGSTGPSGLHHLVYEVVDNAVDEALAGYATRIDVTLLADGGCRVIDDGRGIPVDPHPEYPDKSAAEIVLTMLHAGGKFGGEGYKISGGLHGVGVSVVNALSRRLELEIERDGGKYEMTFVDGGEPVAGLARIGDSRQDGDDGHLLARPDDHGGGRLPRPDPRRAPTGDGLPQQEPRDRLSRRTGRRAHGADLQVRRRHRRLRRAPERVEGAVVRNGHRRQRRLREWRGRDRAAVEHGLLRGPPLLREQHRHDRRRDARGGLQEVAHQRGQPLRPGEGTPQGEGREPPRRGHPRGPHRDRVREAAQPAVRGADEDQARQHRDPVVRRAGDERRSSRSGSRNTRPSRS